MSQAHHRARLRGADRNGRRHRRARPFRFRRPLRTRHRLGHHHDDRRLAGADHSRHRLGGPFNVGKMLQAAEALADQLRVSRPRQFASSRNRSSSRWRPAASGSRFTRIGARCRRPIDCCLKVADAMDFQVQIHTDTLNEIRLSRGHARRHRRAHNTHVSHRGRRRRPRARHHPGRGRELLPALLNQPNQPLHGQHFRRTSRHDDGVPSPEPRDPRGRRLRREPHPPADHRRRGRAARHRRHLDAGLRQSGHGPHPRGDLPHLAARLQDEGPARRLA